MSLLDALLLEPPKFEVWIALRTDGVLGSGTQADPYDGSAIKSAPLSISNLSLVAGTTVIAEATTQTNHNFIAGDVIVISRSTNPADGDWWDGTFTVRSVTASNRFTYVMRREAVGGTPAACTVQKYLAWHFDERMRDVPANAAIHIGPGTFETRGSAEGLSAPPGWRPKNGQRIVGAGMGLTTLKLVGATVPFPGGKAAVIVSDELLSNGMEVADLTIDCNADGQPSDLSPVDAGPEQIVCAAILVSGGGRHFYGRRIRAVNFGALFRDFYSENFVLYATPSNSNEMVNAIWEDCVAEFPSPNNRSNSFMFLAGGTGERDYGGPVMTRGRGCVIRNCYVDGRNSYGAVVPIQSISYSGTQVTVRTKVPHGRRRPGNVLITGVTAGAGHTLDNTYNGIFAIDEVSSDTELKYTPASDPGGPGTGGRSAVVFPAPKSGSTVFNPSTHDGSGSQLTSHTCSR